MLKVNLLPPDNRGLQIVVIAGLVVAIALVLVVIYRVAFGHRLRVPGGSRARQPRLGLVDAFSLDGQRQLVLVRRDNIEHLIMIGGPNDILVESQIIRAAASPLARERDAAAVKALPMTPARVAEGAPAVAIETPPAPPELGPQPPQIAPRIEPPPIKPAPRARGVPGWRRRDACDGARQARARARAARHARTGRGQTRTRRGPARTCRGQA